MRTRIMYVDEDCEEDACGRGSCMRTRSARRMYADNDDLRVRGGCTCLPYGFTFGPLVHAFLYQIAVHEVTFLH